MKNAITALIFLLSGLIIPCLAASEGDYENRVRDAELSGDRAQVEIICKEWYASGRYSAGLLNWNYNALMSVEQNAILFTQQESDTYPALLLQNALELRPDVRVISFQLLENPQYRAFLIEREGFQWIPKDCSMGDFLLKILKPETTGNASMRPVYFGSMTNKSLLLADKEKLYLTGLALKFSTVSFDNLAMLRYNFENRFRTDYLSFNFEPESDPATVARVNLNYIPAFLLLHRHYSAAGEREKAERMKNMALNIARTGGRETEVAAFFTPEQPLSNIISAMTPKMLEKPMKRVSNQLFAAEAETSNAQYELFLTDLLKNKDFEQLEKCKTTKTDWVSLLPKELQHLPEKQLFQHGHPDDGNAPVQNISHEAAQRYCAWITQVYNASSDKKKYKKVLFRLPTEAEWMAAARAGRKDVPYPWGGYYVRNSKGCYLGNYNTTEPCGDCPGQTSPYSVSTGNDNAGEVLNSATKTSVNADATDKQGLHDSNDGGFFSVPVTSYYPNDFGLYAISGNVAEMISEAGKTKGGSWQDSEYYGQISTVKMVNGPSPAVGFRVFMEIIEE
jgi:formylglycine-generating enzyme required for sulfatase activity